MYELFIESVRKSSKAMVALGAFSPKPCYHTFVASYYVFFKMDGAYAVPDPELMLLDSNFIEPNKFKILFGPYRKYGASTHFIHFNFSQLLATPDKIFQQYHNYIEQLPELFQTQTEEIVEVSRSCIADKINDFVDILDALPQHQIVNRHKCFHDLVALGMSTTALTLSTYNSTCISMLESQIVLNNKSPQTIFQRS